MVRSKYNVSGDKSKRTYDGIVFDSELEMKYYRDYVLPLYEKGEITHYELQKKYELQPKCKYNGKTVLAIDYVADFYIVYADGHEEVIDTKGCPDSVAKIKKKMFYYHYPTITFKWITFVKKYGGWIEYDEYKRLKREEKKK